MNLNLLVDFAINLFFAFLGVVVAIWYENLGSPRLLLIPGNTTDDVKPNGWRVRFLHINVKNSPKKVPLVTRQTAYSVHGTVTFIRKSDGKQVGQTMPIRWDGAPEPIKFEVANGQVLSIPDPRLVRISRYIDIPPDEQEGFAIAVRIYDEKTAFGWTSESYFQNWRHNDYALPIGEYVAKVRLTTGDATFEGEFPFANFDAFEPFALSRRNAG
ncbi:MAG: hypothetical protein N3E40_06625 [Dehalococcoidia bacterium]|nr:hypothetical protein [Dehalococcoidia bacterium]